MYPDWIFVTTFDAEQSWRIVSVQRGASSISSDSYL